jgi:hypothetical protein
VAGDRPPVALDVEAEARAMIALDALQRSIRQAYHGPGVDLDRFDRLHKLAMLGSAEYMRRYSHPLDGRPRVGVRQSQASRLAIAATMKRVVQFKPRDNRGRFAR